jgi:hypothetical protein
MGKNEIIIAHKKIDTLQRTTVITTSIWNGDTKRQMFKGENLRLGDFNDSTLGVLQYCATEYNISFEKNGDLRIKYVFRVELMMEAIWCNTNKEGIYKLVNGVYEWDSDPDGDREKAYELFISEYLNYSNQHGIKASTGYPDSCSNYVLVWEIESENFVETHIRHDGIASLCEDYRKFQHVNERGKEPTDENDQWLYSFDNVNNEYFIINGKKGMTLNTWKKWYYVRK